MKNQPTLKGSFRTKGETLVAKACRTVPGFNQTYNEFERHLTLQQRSKSAMMNYGRSLAKVALHFGIDPLHLSMEQINDYLYSMLKTGSPSKSYFRHTVYGLKNLYRMKGKDVKALQMPPVRDNGTLPVVLSCKEIKRMLATTKNQKHRVQESQWVPGPFNMSSMRPLNGPVFRNRSPAIRFVIPLLPICSNKEWTCSPSKSNWVMPGLIPPWFTYMWHTFLRKQLEVHWM